MITLLKNIAIINIAWGSDRELKLVFTLRDKQYTRSQISEIEVVCKRYVENLDDQFYFIITDLFTHDEVTTDNIIPILKLGIINQQKMNPFMFLNNLELDSIFLNPVTFNEYLHQSPKKSSVKIPRPVAREQKVAEEQVLKPVSYQWNSIPIEFLSGKPNLENNSIQYLKENLFENLEPDEVVINIDELADLLAKDTLESENGRLETHLERYKFLLSRYTKFIKSVKREQ